MSRDDSPLRDRMIFAFGSRRSGTWWLQRMLTAHPLVSAVPSETYLFTLGIKPLFERFHHGLRSSPTVGQVYVDRDVLLDATRDLCDGVFAPFLGPDARYVSERTPGHAAATDAIAAVYPDARLVHIIRDGRDVARSLTSRDWGPESVAEAAREWRDAILAARTGAPSDRYREVRYEDLIADPQLGMRQLFEWMELPVDADALDQVAIAARRPLNQDPKDPRLGSGKWRDHFSPADLAAFLDEAGELLDELGYDAEEESPGGRVRSAARPVRSLIARRRQGAAPPVKQSPEARKALVEASQLADAVLQALHAGDRSALRERLDADVQLRTVDGIEQEDLSGDVHVTDALLADPTWRGRQVSGGHHPGIPWSSYLLSYETPDGVVTRMLALQIRGAAVREVALYRLATIPAGLPRT